jgi:hypothetical protein
MNDEPQTVKQDIDDAMLYVIAHIVNHMLTVRANAQNDDNELRRAEVLRAWSQVNRDMEDATEMFQNAVGRALALPQ